MKAFLLLQLRFVLIALTGVALLVLLGVPTLWAALLGVAFVDLATILTLGKPIRSRRRPKLQRLRPARVYLN